MNPVYITYANQGYLQFALNLCKNFNDIMDNELLVFYCLDTELYNLLSNLDFENIKFINLNCKDISSSFLTYGSYEYNKLTHTKIYILQHALSENNFIHFIDCDVAFLKKPTYNFYSSYDNFDIVYQVDSGPQDGDTYIWVCTGNMTLKNTNNTKNFLNKLLNYICKTGIIKNDQECLFEMLKSEGIQYITDVKDIKMNVYPHDKLVNGWYYKKEGLGENALNFHANYVTGSENKIEMLKSVNLWYN